MADDSSKITYFLAGVGVGAVIGILFAPRSGEETRQYLGEKATEGRDYMAKKGREVREQAEEYVSKGKEAYRRAAKDVGEAVEAGKQAYREARARERGEEPSET